MRVRCEIISYTTQAVLVRPPTLEGEPVMSLLFGALNCPPSMPTQLAASAGSNPGKAQVVPASA